MAGIYIHIPFCKSRCKYCDFFSTTQLEKRPDYVDALLLELAQRKGYLTTEHIHTIYFGGGTPSLLTEEQLSAILQNIRRIYKVDIDAEVTLEANPGDLSLEKLRQIKASGINRLSIGIQSFNNELLLKIGRRHNASQAIAAVKDAQDAGFTNISIDLIYGLPGQTMELWKEDIRTALSLDIQHISAYCLSYENGTALTRMLAKGKIEEIDEELENEMYDYLVSELGKHGLEKYEVSNFAQKGYYSQHNSCYWDGTPYLGLGAGAHSFDGRSRQWNVANLNKYIAEVNEGKRHWKKELLSDKERYYELVMLSLRTKKGLNLNSLGEEERIHLEKAVIPYLGNKQLEIRNNQLFVTQEGTHILNRIIEDIII